MIYDSFGRTEPSRIYLAKPGKQILGCLNGVAQDTANLNIDFINADELSFDVYKYHDGEPTSYYEYIDVLMEIFVDNYGWFVIDESPSVHNDGIREYMTVTAKSYEYMLHRYDLSGFDVNTADPTSREMLAADNVYTYFTSANVWYNVFRDRVLFYRDSSDHDALLEEIDENTTYEQLKLLLVDYPQIAYQSWRITIPIGASLRAGFVTMRDNAPTEVDRHIWESWIDSYDSQEGVNSDGVKALMLTYPELIQYIDVTFNKKKMEQTDDGKYIEGKEELTAYEFVELERQRVKDLSLLDLVISDAPGWSVGFVDPDIPEGKQVRLSDEVGSFQVDSQDVYTFLVTELSGYFECIFEFDTIHSKINAYRIQSVGEDTKIFLGFRNVQNSVDITPAQELFTQFTVESSEGLSILYANFGEREIEDISYFLNENYLPQELIDKYQAWLEYRESRRDEYIEICRQYNKQYDVVQEIMNRVPSDMLDISQLENFKSKEQLEEVIDNYYALAIGIMNNFIYVSTDEVEPPHDKSYYNTFVEYTEAMDDYITALEDYIDVDAPFDAVKFEDSIFYNDWAMMLDFTIPNLITTYTNLDVPSYEDKDEYEDAFMFDLDDETGFGSMYGITELKNLQKSHEDKMTVYKEYELDWDDIPDTEEGRKYKARYAEIYYRQNHELYEKYKEGYESATAAIARRQAEYDTELATLDDIGEQRQAIADDVKKENFEQEGQLVFTKADLKKLSHLLKHTDYVNDNIAYLEHVDTTEAVVDKHIEMYGEAIEELFVESHPQYTYSTSVDDLLANNEYSDYHPDFKVGNFIRLGLDDETQVLLRLVGITFNPMIYDNNLQLTFSNMVRYRSKRNDFTNLLQSALTSAKNSINARYNRSADNDNTVQVTYDLVQKILQTSQFTNFTQNIRSEAVSAANGSFNSLTAGFLRTTELVTELAKITTMDVDSAFIKFLEANLVVASEIKVDDLKAKLAQVDTIVAGSAFMNFLESDVVVSRSLTTDSIDASNINVDNLFAQSGLFKYLESNLIVASEIKVDDLKAKLALVDSVTAGSAFANYLQSAFSTSIQSVVNDAYIYNAVAGKISVADLAAGTIVLTDYMTIISENENGGNVLFDGDALQFTDSEGNVGIEIGYGSQTYPHIVIKDDNGTSLWTSTGVTSAGIGDDIIYGRMINDETIGKEKLNFPIVDTDENGNISITNILDGSGNNFGVEYTYFKNATEANLDTINNVLGSVAIIDTQHTFAVVSSSTVRPTTDLYNSDYDVLEDSEGNILEVSEIWHSEIGDVPEGYYIWEKTTFTYNNGTTRSIYSVRPGASNVIVVRQAREYALSTSTTTLPPDPVWQESVPYADADHFIWMRNRTDYSDGVTVYSDAIYEASIGGLISRVDYNEQQIVNRIWRSDITSSIDSYDSTTINTIRTRVTNVEQDIDGYDITVGDVTTHIDGLGERMTSAEGHISVNSNMITAMVTIDDETSAITLTENMISAVTDQFVVIGSDGTETVIQGGAIQTNSIRTSDLATDSIKSTNYQEEAEPTSILSEYGTFIDLANGNIYSTVFAVDTDTRSGIIAGLNITETGIYSGNKTADNLDAQGFFLSNDGQFVSGDSDNFIASWYDDEEQKWKVSIQADEINFGSGESVSEVVGDILTTAQNAIDDVAGGLSQFSHDVNTSIGQLRDDVDQNTNNLNQIVGESGVIEIVPSEPYIALRVINDEGKFVGGRIKITNNRIELLDEHDLNVTWIEAGEMSSGSFNFTELNPRYFNGDQMTGTLKWIARRNGHLTLKNINNTSNG